MVQCSSSSSYLIVTESRQLVDDRVVRVGDIQQCQGERNHTLHGQLSIVQQVVERTHAHLNDYYDRMSLVVGIL